jgi:hypothetical protein
LRVLFSLVVLGVDNKRLVNRKKSSTRATGLRGKSKGITGQRLVKLRVELVNQIL